MKTLYITIDGSSFESSVEAVAHELKLLEKMLANNTEFQSLFNALPNDREDWGGCTLSRCNMFKKLYIEAVLARGSL